MRTGFILAIVIHVVLVGFAIFSLRGASMDEAAMQTQALPVSLVPLEDEMQLTQGASEAPRGETPAPTPTRKPQEMEQAQHVGDGDIDINAPLAPKEKPREVEVAAASTAVPQVEENTPPRTDTPPVPDAKQPDPVPQPEPPVATQEPEPQLPEEVPQPPQLISPPPSETPQPVQEAASTEPEKKLAEVETPPSQPAQPTLPDRAPAPTQKPKMTAKAPQNPPKPEKPASEAQATRPEKPVETVERPALTSQTDNLEDILAENAALLDRTRTQGGGARRAEAEAAFGSRNTNNDDGRLAQTISNVIGGCVQRNWRLASISGSSAYDLAVKVRVKFNPDGTIDGEPELEPSGGDGAQREIITYQASAALRKCAPFNLPADQYSKWRDVTINMRAFPG